MKKVLITSTLFCLAVCNSFAYRDKPADLDADTSMSTIGIIIALIFGIGFVSIGFSSSGDKTLGWLSVFLIVAAILALFMKCT